MEFNLDQLTPDAAPAKAKRGRPRLHASAAEKQAAHRARHELVAMTVELPADVVAAFNEYLKFKNLTKNEVITKLLKTQLLRKR